MLAETLAGYDNFSLIEGDVMKLDLAAVAAERFAGLRPVVVGLIASAAMLLMNGANFGTDTRSVCFSVGICVVAFCGVFFAKWHPILVICLAAVAGLIIFY